MMARSGATESVGRRAATPAGGSGGRTARVAKFPSPRCVRGTSFGGRVVTRKLEKTRPGDSEGAAAPATTFEQAIARLGEIVDSLEEGEQPLEESIALFEEGMTLAKSSQEILDRAERRIEELLGVDAQGKPVVRELEPD
jgi:exodeoxyribonuclease VII small subunit